MGIEEKEKLPGWPWNRHAADETGRSPNRDRHSRHLHTCSTQNTMRSPTWPFPDWTAFWFFSYSKPAIMRGAGLCAGWLRIPGKMLVALSHMLRCQLFSVVHWPLRTSFHSPITHRHHPSFSFTDRKYRFRPLWAFNQFHSTFRLRSGLLLQGPDFWANKWHSRSSLRVRDWDCTSKSKKNMCGGVMT